MATEETEVDVYKTSKATIYQFVFFGVVVLLLVLVLRGAAKKGAKAA